MVIEDIKNFSIIRDNMQKGPQASSNTKSKHPVIQTLWERKKMSGKAGNFQDGRKIGVVVEGGALRGIISARQLVVLKKAGLLDCVDVIYGESIGGPNAAWALSGQLETTIRAYYEDVNNKKFINPLRLLVGKPVVNADYLQQVVMKKYPINIDVVLEAGIKLRLLGTYVNCPESNHKPPIVSMDHFKNTEDFISIVRGVIRMPFLEGPPFKHSSGIEIWDVGIVDKLPVQVAIEDGCTHILVLCCVPEGDRINQYPMYVRMFMKYYLSKFNPALSNFFNTVKPRYNKTLEFLEQKQLDFDNPPFIATLQQPAGTKRLGSFEMDANILQQAEDLAEKAAIKTLGLE